MRTRLYLFITAILALLASGITYALVNDADAASKQPGSLIGSWYQTDVAEGIIMDAEVSEGSIQINMKLRGEKTGNIYWMGTFDSDKQTNSSWETISLADPDAAANSIFGSRDKTKVFTYDSGQLSFRFKIMGTTTTIHLAKK